MYGKDFKQISENVQTRSEACTAAYAEKIQNSFDVKEYQDLVSILSGPYPPKKTTSKKWTPEEMLKLEMGIKKYGKNASELSKVVETRNTKQIVDKLRKLRANDSELHKTF